MSKRSLPAVVSSIPRDLRTFLDRLRDMLTDGSLDRLVTARDLSDAGLVAVSGSGAITPPGSSIPAPPAPTGLAVTASLSTIFVEWDAPVYAGHAYAEVWAAPTNSIGDAVKVGMAPGAIFVDSMEFDTTRYYWVRFVNIVDTAGPFNGVSGVGSTTGQDVDKLVAAMTGPGDPFKAVPTEVTLPDGSVVPAGTYTADAFIHNGQITNAKIANLAVDNAKIANLSVGKLTAGSIATAEYIQSTGYVAGSAGWRINGNGNAEFSNVTIRGAVYATSGSFSGTLAADIVKTNNIEVGAVTSPVSTTQIFGSFNITPGSSFFDSTTSLASLITKVVTTISGRAGPKFQCRALINLGINTGNTSTAGFSVSPLFIRNSTSGWGSGPSVYSESCAVTARDGGRVGNIVLHLSSPVQMGSGTYNFGVQFVVSPFNASGAPILFTNLSTSPALAPYVEYQILIELLELKV